MLKRAFTLIELLVTMAVVSFIAAFAVPSFQVILSQLQLNSATDATADLIRLAQQRTVTEQVSYGVTFAIGSSTVTLFRYNTPPTANTTIETYTLPTNISITDLSVNSADALSWSVRFTASGAPFGSDSGDIILTDTIRGVSRTIQVRPSGSVLALGGASPSPIPSAIASPCPTPLPSPIPSPVPSPVPSPIPSPVPSAAPKPIEETPEEAVLGLVSQELSGVRVEGGPSPSPSPVVTGPPCAAIPVPTPIASPSPSPVPSPIPSPVPSPSLTAPRPVAPR